MALAIVSLWEECQPSFLTGNSTLTPCNWNALANVEVDVKRCGRLLSHTLGAGSNKPHRFEFRYNSHWERAMMPQGKSLNSLINRWKRLFGKHHPESHVHEPREKLQLLDATHSEPGVNYADLVVERNNWKRTSERLQLDQDYVADRRAKGHLFEFDYGYSPRQRNWDRLPIRNPYKDIIAGSEIAYRGWITAAERYADSFRTIECHGSPDAATPYWANGWFPPLDGIFLYTLLAETNPGFYFEVGSGNSTKFARKAISDHDLRTRIVSIDPHPRAVIDDICDEVIRSPLEDTDLLRFTELGAGDILFIDNSHRSFPGSDATVFFTEVLPLLKSGVLWGVHDIFLPGDYPESWSPRMYNEQYLLMTYLLGGANGDTVELPVAYVAQQPHLLEQLCGATLSAPAWQEEPLIGGAFWMRKA